MLHFTPQERLALGVTALLLAAGAGVRMLAAPAEPASWVDSRVEGADTSVVDGQAPRAEAERNRDRERVRAMPLAAGERIDPSTASADELDRLPRVGPELAARIVAHRTEHGRFRSLEDLDAVPGVGPALLARLEPHVALEAVGTGRGGGGTAAGKVALNRATAEELEALPGIGRVLAERIVEQRRARGGFRSLEELEEVPGVGPALRARLAPKLRL